MNETIPLLGLGLGFLGRESQCEVHRGTFSGKENGCV